MHLSTVLLLLSFSVALNGLRQDAVPVQKVSFEKERKCDDSAHRKPFKLSMKAMTSCKEPVSVVVELEDESGMHTIVPKRVMTKRCVGSCYNQLSCMPMSTTKREIAVMRSDILRGDKTCGWVTVEDHVDCGCQCNLMETECGTDMHMYDPDNCNCYCMNMEEGVDCSAKGRVWDTPTCSCNCHNQTAECSTGQHFDKATCLCV